MTQNGALQRSSSKVIPNSAPMCNLRFRSEVTMCRGVRWRYLQYRMVFRELVLRQSCTQETIPPSITRSDP